MLDIGWTELLVIAVVLIVVVGPKDLPPMLRAFGKMTGNLRKMAGDFRTQFDQALREADMDDVRQTLGDVQKFHPANAIREAINPLREMGNEIRNDLHRSTTLPVSSCSETAGATEDGAGVSTTAVEDLLPAASLGLPETALPTQPPASLSQPNPQPQQAPVAVAQPAAVTPQPAPVEPVKAASKASKASKVEAKTGGADQVAAKPSARKRVVKAEIETAPVAPVPSKPVRARKPAAVKAVAVAAVDNDAKAAAPTPKQRKKPTGAQAKAPKQPSKPVDVPKDEV